MSFVIFDTEYIADKGLFEDGFNGWQHREIIQIAAIKVSENLKVLDKLNFYTKPYLHAKIPPYFVNITGITDQIMKSHGIDFITAYEAFAQFTKNLNCYSHGWGSSAIDRCDGEIIDETLNIYSYQDTHLLKYFNIAPWFQSRYKQNNLLINKQASGEIATLLGVEKKLSKIGLNPHNAFYDVYSILEGLRYFGFRQQSFMKLLNR